MSETRMSRVARYSPDETPCEIDLSDNTNLWGMSPAAAEAIAGAASVSRYPTAYGTELKRAIASYLGVESTMIATGCGSDDVLDSAMRALAEPGDVIAFPAPTFSMIPSFAAVCGVVCAPIAMGQDCSVDADALLATRARIIYLCSPNNPTSGAIARDVIERVVRDAPGIVIIDEAYAEFAETTCVDLLSSSGRLLITRTMSKAFGLAGLRVGYCIASPECASEIEKARGPYKVNALAERAGVAALTTGLPWMRARVGDAIDSRERLSAELRLRGFAVVQSAANFLFVPTADARAIAARLRVPGIAVRLLHELPVFGDALRITAGPWEQMQRMLDALDSR